MKLNLDYKWMQLAFDEAKLAETRHEVPVGAVIVDTRDNKLISKSGNNIVKKSNPIAHAEIEVIDLATKKLNAKYLKNTSIYITLEPCVMCATAICEVRIDKIYFGAFDKKKGAFENDFLNLKDSSYFKPEIYGGIMEEKCSNLITNFFKKIRK